MATEQLGGEQIGFIGLGSGWGLAVLGKPLLDTVKKVLGYQRRDAIRDNDVTERVFTNIPTIGQHTLDGAIVDGLALGIGKVTADATVELVNSINSGDKKVLNIGFAGIEKAGDNTVEKTYTEAVSVAEMPSSALFGTWSGKFNYRVDFIEAKPVNLISFTIDNELGGTFQAEEGMTWVEWVNSNYNTGEFYHYSDFNSIMIDYNGSRYSIIEAEAGVSVNANTVIDDTLTYDLMYKMSVND